MNRKPAIYVLCPDTARIGGGVKQLYRHVDVLNRNGFSAFILHSHKGFRANFFENDTKVIYASSELKKEVERGNKTVGMRQYLKQRLSEGLTWPQPDFPEVKFCEEDFLVIPEIYGLQIPDIAKGIRKVIFNQNCHLTFQQYPLEGKSFESAYHHKDILATLVVSQHSFEYLKHVFPKHRCERIYCGIDASLFGYSPHKKKQIAFMSRKLRRDAKEVINILRFRGVLRDYELVNIDQKKENEVASILKESLFFLSFSNVEGCPLPPMEAMACGCLVIGYDGIGGREYFKEPYGYPVASRDILDFAKMVEKVIAGYETHPESFIAKGRNASAYILREYALERETSSIVRFWSDMFKIERCGQKIASTV